MAACQPASSAPADVVSALFAVYEKHGGADYIGEAVSSLEHALQAAACARGAGSSDAVIAGALLHDIGHLLGLAEPAKYERMGNCGVMAHEGIGGALLERLGLPASTCAHVRRHVDAKRYLVAVDPGYHAGLSAASKTTLTFQGGPMSAEEVAAFQADPMGPTILAMRRWDEAAKVPGLPVPPLESYRGLLEGLLAGDGDGGGGNGTQAA